MAVYPAQAPINMQRAVDARGASGHLFRVNAALYIVGGRNCPPNPAL